VDPAGARRGDVLESVRLGWPAVSSDVAVLRTDHEQHEILLADARDTAPRGGLDVHDASRPELEALLRDVEPRPSSVDEVELVLLLVEMRSADDSRSEYEGVDAECHDPELAADFPEDAVSHLVDRTVGGHCSKR
jgi:hypothetical protein